MPSQLASPSQAPDGPLILSLSKDEDLSRATLEDQLAGLKELAAIGLEIARGLAKMVTREAEAAEPDPNFDAAGLGLAHDRAARAVRLSYALQHAVIDRLDGARRTEADQAERAERERAEEAQALQAKARAEAEAPERVRKLQIGKAVTGIMADAHDGDARDFERQVREAKERLRDHEVLDNVLGRPASEIIADICRLLGLEPNWEGLAFEAWAQEERDSGKIGSPLQSPPPWIGNRPGVRGRRLQAEPPAEELLAEIEDPPPPEPEIAQPPPPYVPPPDPDILPGYPIGLPGEYPPERPKRRPYWA